MTAAPKNDDDDGGFGFSFKNTGLYGKLSLAGDIESSGQVNTDDVYDQ